MIDPAYLASRRVRIALQGHAPFAAATQAVYETLKALREGTSPEEPEGPCVSRTDRSPHARCRCKGARRRISRAEEIDERRDPSGDDPGPGAGRRLSGLGRAAGEGAAVSRDGCATAATAASRRCLRARADVVAGMVAPCRRGPSSARVDAVEEERAATEALDCDGRANGFRCSRRFSLLTGPWRLALLSRRNDRRELDHRRRGDDYASIRHRGSTAPVRPRRRGGR